MFASAFFTQVPVSRFFIIYKANMALPNQGTHSPIAFCTHTHTGTVHKENKMAFVTPGIASTVA